MYRVQIKFSGQLIPAQPDDSGGNLIGIRLLDKIKITDTVETIQVCAKRWLTLTDLMGFASLAGKFYSDRIPR